MSVAERHQKILKEEPISKDQKLHGYISGVLARLHGARASGAGKLTLTIINKNVPNAYTIGQGYIYLYTGLLKIFRSEAEMAMVLGHEIAHGDLRHIDQGRIAGIFAAIVGRRPGVRGAIAKGGHAAFGRMQERFADFRGLRYLSKAGYNTNEGVKAFKRLQDLGGTSLAGYWKASHPLSAERFFVLSRLSKRLPGGKRIGINEYQQGVLSRLK